MSKKKKTSINDAFQEVVTAILEIGDAQQTISLNDIHFVFKQVMEKNKITDVEEGFLFIRVISYAAMVLVLNITKQKCPDKFNVNDSPLFKAAIAEAFCELFGATIEEQTPCT